jgi:subtilase family serine protease
VYKLTKPVTGCDPALAKATATGGSKAIAIVDAFDDPYATGELALFSSTFGLPVANFQVAYASGTQPPPAPLGWLVEIALDIEMAHAMAPNAKIYLVEAASDANTDLFAAVKVASQLVATAGGGEVSMSWGGSEWSGETAYDSLFTTPGVVYFAASGDGPGTIHPSVSPNVVAVGGTALRRDAVTGYLLQEDAWVDGGGGKSTYEKRPSYQAGVASIVGTQRGVPDVSAVADPNTGVWIASVYCDFCIVGGTSVATPVLAGIVNQAGSFASSTNAELTTIYNNLGVASDFLDIGKGFCGFYAGDAAVKGWDFCTGVGSPLGVQGK